MSKKISLLMIISGLILVNFLSGGNITPLPEGVSIHKLDNGMEVLLIENHLLPMIGSNVVVKVGSAYETFASSGMSHMLEHLLFNGTKSRTQKELYDDTDKIGGYNNANTSEYFTNYMMVTPSEHFEKGMEIQADMLFNSTLPVKKFRKEKGIVLEEISKSLAEPREQMDRNIISSLFKGHALSLPTLGTYSTIEGMTRNDVYEFYKNNYIPNNMIMSVVGNFETKKMLESIKKIYGKAKAGNPVQKEIPSWNTGFSKVKETFKEEKVFHRFYNGKDPVFHQFFEIKKILTPVHLKMVETVLKKRGKEIEKALKADSPDMIKSLKLTSYATPVKNFIEAKVIFKKSGDYNKISGLIKKMLSSQDLSPDPNVVLAEIPRARTNFLKNIEKPHMFGIYNAYNFAVYGINSVLASYSGENFQQAADELKSIKLDTPPVTIIQHTSGEKGEKKESKKKEARVFADKNTGKSLIAVNNGGTNLLAIHYLVKHKAYFEHKYGADASNILHSIFGDVLKSKKSREESSSFGLTFKVKDNPYFPMDDIYLNPDFGYIRVEALADNVPAVINFIKGKMKAFNPSKGEFERTQKRLGHSPGMMMGPDSMAKKVFEKLYKKEIFEENEYSAKKKKITYENFIQFRKEYFKPENMIISVVSPAEPAKIDKLYSDCFTKSSEKPAPFVNILKTREKEVKIDQKGGGKRSNLLWGFTKEVDRNDVPALKALSLILSDKIVFDIREKRGMAYRMSAGISLVNNRALFFIKMGTRPHNVDKLIPIYPGFFNKKIMNSINEGELTRLVNMYLGRMMFRRLSSINRAYYLGYSLYFSGNIKNDQKALDDLKNVKLSDVKRVAGKYLDIKNPVLIIVR
ncbi:MAG: insulinase family protein [Acidobacteriota bacterium]